MAKTPISADSHITEPPNCYIDHIDPSFRDRAPHLINDEKYGDVYVIEGMEKTIPIGLVAAAGKDPRTLRMSGGKFDELHRSGWDGTLRAADQDLDGVCAEIIYPSVGMVLCNHPDFEYKQACMTAYNRWLQTYCEAEPDRLFGMAQLAMASVEGGIKELRQAKEMGFRGVMMPGNPQHADYDHTDYDPFYQAAVDLGLPLSFHILTSNTDKIGAMRGPRINGFSTIIRGCQDIIGMFIFGGVFQRHPDLKLVCVEADAGWAPHYMYRMDHAYNHHRFWMKCDEMERLPSEYFKENVYMTFQDDWIAFKFKDECNIRRLMWANDFPHSDATWPRSQELLAEHTAHMTQQEKDWVLHENVSELYGLNVA
ncbi:MAG: amidohydrolase family protein [Alphaproteobacteria bacterium]|jgi:predicted TIM-barrel fold metal-dependent hydrolase